MNTYFESLLEGYNNQANNSTVKSVIYDAMEKCAYSYRPDYVCYDMAMYVALYNCATSTRQRKHTLEHIESIIDDDYIGHEELLSNFKEFIVMKDFLKNDDEKEFDAICMKALNFFEEQKKDSKSETFAGQADSIPDVPLWQADKELKEVAEIIVSTGMNNLESYQNAQLVLGHWNLLAVSISHGFFLNLKKSLKICLILPFWL